MAKNTCKATEVKRKPKYPIKKYLVFLPYGSGEDVPLESNSIEQDGETLVFKILWDGADGMDEEIVAMFRVWDYFIDCDTLSFRTQVKEWGSKFESMAKHTLPPDMQPRKCK